MRDPTENQGGFLTMLLLFGLLAGLLYLLYLIAGEDLSRLSGSSGGNDPITQLVNSLRGFGSALRDAFSRAMPWR